MQSSNDSNVIVTRLALHLSFVDPLRPWSELRELLRVTTRNAEAEIQAQSIDIDDAENHRRIRLQVRGIRIDSEHKETVQGGFSDLVNSASKLNKATQLPRLSRIRYESIAIAPYSAPFHELVSSIKDVFLAPNQISQRATDLAMVFDERDEGLLRHIQIGPMDAEQLRREFLRWPPDTLPDTFLFLGLDYEYNKEMAFDLQVLRQVGRDAASWQEKCRAEITSLLIS